MPESGPPPGARVRYSRQYRRCAKPGCPSCGEEGLGHGPYWYAYWREGGRQRSRYLGKDPPSGVEAQGVPVLPALGDPLAPPAPPVPAAGRRQATPQLRVRTLGGLTVWRGEADLHAERWRPRNAVALLACLLDAPGQRLRREELAERLWPEGEPGAGLRNLRGAVHHLRRLLGEAGPGEGYLRQEGEFLRLDPAPGGEPVAGWLDALAFARAAEAALAGRDAQACRAALALYGGEYLPEEPYAEWAAATREKLAGRYLALLLHLAALCRAAGEAAEAERRLREALAVDSCHEGAAEALMGLLAGLRRRGDALRVYQQVAAALDRELGLGPQPALEGMRARLLAETATPVAADYAPRLRLPGRPTNLPASASSFVGRAWELAEVRALLGETRLLTLTGPGGCGKSRLAQEAAGALLDEYPDGVWLVELAALADPALVPGAVASVLGVAEPVGRPLLEALADFLAPRRLLLLLDNCEHLLDSCAEMVAQVLARCPDVCLLATSRQALDVAGEVAWLVPALPYPGAEEVPSTAALAQYEAVQLFAARARAHRPAFALSEANAGAVARVCRQLDGLPLALELAAARLGALSVEEVAARLGDRLALLGAGSRTALPRHRTLRATLDWSWDLLEEGERTLLRRLSVFAGGWTLEAAEAVCGGGEVLDLLAGLVAKSLVQVAEQEGRSRYDLLETVRQYAAERLEASGEAAAVHERQLTYYLAKAERAEPELTGPEQGIWLAVLEAEHDNLRAALGWARASGNGERGLRLARALHRFWSTRGYLTEGRGWLETLLAAAGSASDAVRATALHGAGSMAFAQGAYPQAAALYEASLALHRVSGDRRGIAICLNGLGVVAYRMGDLARAGMLYEESLVLFREMDDRTRIAVLLLNLGWIAGERGADQQAVALLQESLALRRELGDQQGTAFALHGLAMVAYRRGDLAQAATLQAEALALRRALGDTPGIAYSLQSLGLIAYRQGDLDRAAALHEESLALQRELGDRGGIVVALNGLGLVLAQQGAHGRAQAHFQESLRLSRDIGARGELAKALEGLAWVAAMRGQPEQAARLGGAAQTTREALGIPLESEQLDGHEQTVQATRAALGDAAFASAWAGGRALAPEQAVAEALAGG